MTRDEIAKEFDRFFEFDTDDRSIVTSVSARLFAEHIAALVAAAEREACAKVCEYLRDRQIYADKQEAQNDCAAAIRARGKK